MGSLFKKVEVMKPTSKPAKKAADVEIPKRGDSDLVNRVLDMFDKWHGHKEIWDDELDAQIHRWEWEIRSVNKKRLNWGKKGTRYFTPSSANSDSRELYMKLTGAPRDQEAKSPHQGRWTRMGSAFGDMLQRDLLFIEKHWEKEFGEKPPFVPYYTEINGRRYPMWEKFSQHVDHIEHKGKTISIIGLCDGILVDTSTGELVLLEIKSKQTTAAQTGFYSMKEAKDDHERQTVLYSHLFRELNISSGMVLYGNLSKKAWIMDAQEYAANPDLRGFEIELNDTEREKILDKFHAVITATETKEPPKLDIMKWTFNSFKEATVASLTQEEFDELFQQVERIKKSRMPAWKKNGVIAAWDYIVEHWNGGATDAT